MAQGLEYLEYPQLLGLGVVRSFSDGRAQPRHVHDSLCFGCVHEGRRELRTGDQRLWLEAGACMVVNPGQPHMVEDLPGTRAVMFNLPKTSFSRLVADIHGPDAVLPHVSSSVTDDGHLFKLLNELDQSLVELGLCPDRGDILSCEDGLHSVLGRLLSRHSSLPEAAPAPPGAVERARCMLEERFAEGVELAELAEAAGLSPCRLNRAFSRSVGIPPGEYRHHLRVRRAKALLRDGASIVDAALETGYADQSHFTRAFMRITGMTPGTYRKGMPAVRKA